MKLRKELLDMVLISLYRCNCGKSAPINIATSLSSTEVKSRSRKCL